MTWLEAITPPGADATQVRRALDLAVACAASPERQARVALGLLGDHGRVEPRAVLDLLWGRRRGHVEAVAAQVDAAGRLLAAAGATVLVAGQPGYPERLEDLGVEFGAPLWLFVRGALTDHAAVAVVGSRHPSLDGADVAVELGRLLAREGVCVVSGFARGIDQAAHRGALQAGGDTVAVLGTGFGVDYPRGDGSLRERIAAQGALVTEFPPGAGPRPPHFLWRNRILSALADAVVVVEGRARSGALATARLAAEQGRDVWAVPGSLHQPTARAPLDLIRDGARPLTRLDDVLASLPASAPRRSPGALAPQHADGGGAASGTGHVPRDSRGSARSTAPTVLDGPASVVAGALTAVPASADALRAATGLALPTVLAALAELTAQGRARTTPRGWVSGDAA